MAVALLLLGLGGLWWLTRPVQLAASDLPTHQADAARGARLFWAGGCASCHAAPKAKGEERLKLGGGLELKTAFGTFVAPNISPDPQDGIGEWTDAQFVTAMREGVSPKGEHYYPAFPYTSYARASVEEMLDLKAYLDTLPAVKGKQGPHRLSFPYSFRRGIGLWKRAYLDALPVRPARPDDALWMKGQALVEGWGHCGECHSPRHRAGGIDRQRWLTGAPALEGEGKVPAITAKALDGWSEDDIAYYLESGFTPEFDAAGGAMADVVTNMANLPAEDRAAIAHYLKTP